MRRSSLPARKTPLTARTPLARTGALTRRGALVRQSDRTRQAPVAAKRPKVTRDERDARKALHARSDGLCEACGREPAREAHHRQNRSQGGLWAVENLLHLDALCHQRATVNPALARSRGWSVRSTEDPATVPVWLAGRGWHHLNPDGSTVPTDRSAA